jgi:transposase
MAKRYRPVDRDQLFLLPPDMREWLPAGHPVHLVIRVIGEHLDTGAFHAYRRTGGAGTAGYDPDMLVTVLVWAYAHQVTSSRRIGQLCGTDVAFRLICAGSRPDHATFARFRAGFPGVIAAFFAEVLALCAALGMGKPGVVALDGTKIAASASKPANRTEDKLRTLAEETVAAHAAADAAEDALFGDARGDEVPGDAWSPRRRDERIAAALAGLQRERLAAEAGYRKTREEHLAEAAAGTPRTGPPPAGTEVGLARMQVERATAAQQAKIDDWENRNAAKIAATGTGLRSWVTRPASAHVRVREAAAKLEKARQRQAAAAARTARKDKDRKGPGPVRNITDPDSRLMPVRGGGFIQGYNAQNVASEDGLIIATRLTRDTGDTTWLKPMTEAAEAAATLITARQPRAHASGDGDGDGDGQDAWRLAGYHPPAPGGGGYHGPIGLLLADAGYCSEDNIAAAGPPRLIATGKRRDLERKARGQDPPDSPASPATTAMAGLLQTEAGITARRHRGHISETPHGDIKHNKRFRQLSVRGLDNASAEWQFVVATANLFKAISTGHLTSQALDNLAAKARHPAPA